MFSQLPFWLDTLLTIIVVLIGIVSSVFIIRLLLFVIRSAIGTLLINTAIRIEDKIKENKWKRGNKK